MVIPLPMILRSAGGEDNLLMAERSAPLALTNNPLLKAIPGIDLRYRRVSALGILREGEVLASQGYVLLNHPLNANWQMNVSPYKTLLFRQGKQGDLDINSVLVLEKAIAWLQQLPAINADPAEWPIAVQHDLQFIDLQIATNSLRIIGSLVS